MLRRILIGLVKGLIVGGGLGALLTFVFHVPVMTAGALAVVFYGFVLFLTGVVAGQPPWKEGAWIASILKGIFGFLLGIGLYFLASRFVPAGLLDSLAHQLKSTATNLRLTELPIVFAPLIAAIYGILIELDDGGEQPQQQSTSGTKTKSGVRADVKGGNLDLDALIADSEKASASAKKKQS